MQSCTCKFTWFVRVIVLLAISVFLKRIMLHDDCLIIRYREATSLLATVHIVEANPSILMELSPQFLTTRIINILAHGDIQDL